MVAVRRERPGDAAAIHAVHAASFPTDTEARLVDLLRAADGLPVSLVVEIDEVVVAQIAFSPVTAASGAVGLGLAPLAVAEPHRRRGIAAALVRAGLDACRVAGYGWAVVMAEPAYYSRFEFSPASRFRLSDGYGGGPAFQAIELVAGALPVGAGLVGYAPEFAALGEIIQAVIPRQRTGEVPPCLHSSVGQMVAARAPQVRRARAPEHRH